MSSPRRRTKQKTPAAGRTAGLMRALRHAVVVVVPVAVLLGAAGYVFSEFRPIFGLEQVELYGNEHLTDDEVKAMAGLKTGDGIIGVSSRTVQKKLLDSPWIRSVSVRKDIPGRIEIRIREAAPFALLDLKGKLFIVDDGGKMLEELRNDTIPFLPVIASDPFKEQEAYREAVAFAQSIRKTGALSGKERIEIVAHAPQDMAVVLDGVVVKIGSGDYEEKVLRYTEVEQEIRKRNIPVDYIDLRFAKKVVVKPVHEVIR